MPFLAPVVAAVGTAIATIGATTLGSIALNMAGSLLLSAAASALMRRGGGTDATVIQGRAVSAREAVAPRRMIYGRARVGGPIIYMASRTTPGGQSNNALDIIVVLAGHRVKSIGAVYLNGELAQTALGVVQPRFSGFLWVERHLGGEGPAFPGLASQSAGAWTSQHRLSGCAAVAITLIYDAERYPSGIPNIAVDVEGCDEIFDPRTSVTGYSTNPALCLAHYMAHPTYGLGATIGAADGIATAELIAAANVCDEVVTRVGGGTEPRYACDGIVDLSRDPRSNIMDLLTAMAGDACYQAGQWRIYAGAWRPSVVALTADDVTDGGLALSTRASRSQNFNCVRGTFVSPENDWAADDFPAYVSPVYVAEDGGEQVWADIVLPYTISPSAAQRLAKIHLERQRRQLTVILSGKLSAWRAATMDTVTLDYARWGFAAKPFEVRDVRVAIGEAITPQLTLREASPLVYDWSADELAIYAAAPRTSLPSPLDFDPPGQPSLTESLYRTRTSVGVLLRIDWAPSPSSFLERYQVEARRTHDVGGQATGDQWASLGRTDQLFWEIRDVAAGTWEVRVKAVSVIGISSAYVSASRLVLGLSAAPKALSGVTLQTSAGLAVLKWDAITDLDVQVAGRVVIRHSTSSSPAWSNSYAMDAVPGASALAVVPLKPGTYLLRAEDSSGVQGPVTMLDTKGVPALAFTAVGSSVQHGAFSGTKTNVEVSGLGLQLVLPEKNLAPDANDLTAAGWLATRATVVTDVDTPPGGAATADRIVEDTTASNSHFVYFTNTPRVGATYRTEFVAKSAGRNIRFTFATAGFPDSALATFRLDNGTVILGAGAAAGGMEDLGDGWYGCWVEAVADTAAASFHMLILSDVTTELYTGNGTSGVLIAGVRSFEKLGPPQNALNRWTLTRATVAADQATPPGYTTAVADKLVEDTTGSQTHLAQFQSVIAKDQRYRWSMLLKAAGRSRVRVEMAPSCFTSVNGDFLLDTGEVFRSGTGNYDLWTESLGDGWYRCVIEATADFAASLTANFFLRLMNAGGNTSYTGDGTSGVLVAGVALEMVGAVTGVYDFSGQIDLATVKRARLRSLIDMATVSLTSAIDQRLEPIDQWADFDGTDGVASDVIVEVAKTDDNPAGSPAWSTWSRLDSDEDEFRAAKFRARLISPSTDYNVLVTQLAVYADEVL